ncbi:putative Ig domain-containing protein, partial [Candidatus Poseidonia alphae]|nr:putative Ig domain-containing protein [Candidatus Poseidonia alphae]
SGLLFGPSNGTIYGTPTTVVSSAVTFTVWANNSADDISTTVSITVNDITPVFTYASLDVILDNNTAVSLLPISTGGAVTSWEYIGTEPLGLNFEGGNGTIWGTPTVVQSKTQYLIWGNNSGGQLLVYMNITISDVPVSLSYTSDNYNLTRAVTMTIPISPVYTGIVDAWGIEPSPALAGLSWDSSTGVISGTPNINMTRTEYTVWANNSGGNVSHKFNITINEPIVTLVYTPASEVFVRSTAITDWHPTVTGGNVGTWGIEPSITGTGLSFVNGVISGTPTINMTQADYIVWANTTGGETNFTISITINEPIVTLTYSPASEIFVRGTTITNWLPTVTGGNVETWGIEPSIAGTGLSFVNGVISGTPAINMTQADYIVWANTTGGETNFTISITINEPGVILVYNPENVTVTIGDPMIALTPIVSNGTVEEWTIYPELDNGLDFANGIISGTPTSIQFKLTYRIWANNTGGNTYHEVNITILDIVPEISYSLVSIDLTNDTTSSELPLSPSNLGGPVVSWSIAPDLSLGLSFDPATGIISGTPTEVTALRVYTVTATNTGGTSTTEIEITVLDQVPMVAYVPSDEVLLLNESVLNMVPESTGGAITGWSITPEPSAGLFFDASTGVFSGTPTETMSRTQYNVTATNDVGSMTVSVNITVEDLNYNLSLGPIYLLINEEMTSLEPTSTLSDAVYEVSPDLPDGLFLGESNGTIWGTPTVGMPLTNFTIYANSSLFNDVLEIQIGVLEDSDSDGRPNQLPLDYNPSGGLTEDSDDDGDGFTDAEERDCASDELDADSVPSDLDGDSICDALDDDIDGDGLLNDVETNTSTYVDENDTGTDPRNADSDGDGVCDGPVAPALPIDSCEAGPDEFPNDAAAALDTDGDGMPDQLDGVSTTGLTEDLDDDNDTWTDLDEAACGSTDSKDAMDVPLDGDADGICDVLDEKVLGYAMNGQEAAIFEGYVNQLNFTILPNLTGMEAVTWTIVPALPGGLDFNGMMARSGSTGMISGIPTEASPMTNYTVYANNSQTSVQFTFALTILADTDGDGLPDGNSTTGLETDLDDDNDGILDSKELTCGSDPLDADSGQNDWVAVCLDINDKDDDNFFSWVWCFPCLLIFLLLLLIPLFFMRDAVEVVGPEPVNTTAAPHFLSGLGTKEEPFVLKSVTGLKPGWTATTTEVISMANMTPEIKVSLLDLTESDNDKRFKMFEFNDGSEASVDRLKADQEGGLRIRLVFDDSINPTSDGGVYKGLIKLGMASVYFSWTVSIEGQKKVDTEDKADKTAGSNIAQAMMDMKAQADADAKAAKEVKAQADADAQAAKEVKAQADADAQAAKEVKAQAEVDAKAAKEVKAQAEVDAKAAKEVKAQAEVDAKAAKEVKAQAEADAQAAGKAKAQAEADGKAVAKKLEELERIAKRAKDIDFATLGVASASESDDLQMIKGVGPFIADKLNALGIYTFEQIGNMTGEIEEQVNVAIEFFPGRIKRDDWAGQAKQLSKTEP